MTVVEFGNYIEILRRDLTWCTNGEEFRKLYKELHILIQKMRDLGYRYDIRVYPDSSLTINRLRLFCLDDRSLGFLQAVEMYWRLRDG